MTNKTKTCFRFTFMTLGVIYFVLMTITLGYVICNNLEIHNLASRTDYYLKKHGEGYCDFLEDWEAHNNYLFGECLSLAPDEQKENPHV